MLRTDNVICGTSTTGTGTLTLAACPAPPGGLDFYQWLTATGQNFVNGNAVLVSYTIIEYTSSAFTTASQTEKGVGTLTVGANLAATTLARTTVQSKATGLNAAGATPTFSAPTAFSIGTAANTLVFIGASAADIPAYSPYFDASGTASCSDTVGVLPPGPCMVNPTSGGALSTGTHQYMSFMWAVPILAKRASINVKVAYSGGTPVSNAYMRLYDIATNGWPGKLLYDFGLLGSANTSLNSTGIVATGAAGSGFLLLPGDYYMCLAVAISGGVTAPESWSGDLTTLNTNRIGSNSCAVGAFNPIRGTVGTGTVNSTPNDPALTTSFAVSNSNFSFALNSA